MSFGNPFGLLALAALAPLLAAYFLRRRQKPVPVSALFLWRTPDQKAQAGPKFRRFSRELSLLLEVLAVLAVALYLADLRFGADRPRRSLTVVVDGSLSMSARGTDRRTSAERARDVVDRELSAARADLVTIVESGLSPRVLAGPGANLDEGQRALAAWVPRGATHSLLPTLTMARELAGPGKRIVVVTDALPTDLVDLPPEVAIEAVGEPLPNVAFVSAQRLDEGEDADVALRLANYSGAERAVKVTLRAKPKVPGEPPPPEQTQELTLPKSGSGLVRARFTGAGEVSAYLADDALIEDGKLTLLPAPLSPLSVELAEGLSGSAALKRFFAVTPGLKLSAEPGERADLKVGAPGTDVDVSFGVIGKPKSFVGPFFAEKGHPLLEDVELGGVV